MPIASCIYAFLFVTMYYFSRRNGPPWRGMDWTVVAWGLSYIVGWMLFLGLAFQLPKAGSGPASTAQWFGIMSVAIGLPGTITAVLVGAAFQSKGAFLGVFIATLSAILLAVLAPVTAWLFSALVWHAKTGLSFYHFRPRRVFDPNACPGCGYDLRGLRGAVCPECGNSQP